MKIVSINVNGIRAFKEWKSIEKLDADIICLQEIRVSPSTDLNKFSLGGYKSFWNIGLVSGRGGTGILAREPCSLEDASEDGRYIAIRKNEYVIVTVYVPNSGSNIQNLNSRLNWDKWLRKKLIVYSGSLILVGDMNCAPTSLDVYNSDVLDKTAGFTIQERISFQKLIIEHDLVDAFRLLNPGVRKYTYWDYRTHARKRDAGWRIDFVLVSRAITLKIKSCSIMTEILGSDHCPIIVSLKNPR